MSEPFGNKWKRYKVWPSVLGQSGGTIDHIKLNIGNPSSLQGTQGLQGISGIQGTQGTQGTQGVKGNPDLIVYSLNGAGWEILVDNQGNLSTNQVSPPRN
tara:strand:+ start:304 stop:603 length:300 start_codon:yes stop_codon:yes gene_type:complete